MSNQAVETLGPAPYRPGCVFLVAAEKDFRLETWVGGGLELDFGPIFCKARRICGKQPYLIEEGSGPKLGVSEKNLLRCVSERDFFGV